MDLAGEAERVRGNGCKARQIGPAQAQALAKRWQLRPSTSRDGSVLSMY